MEEQKKKSVVAGYDLCNDRTQIYCCDESLEEPRLVGTSYQPDSEWIPTAVAIKPGGEWLFGQAALDYGRENEGHMLHHFLKDLSLKSLALPEGMEGVNDEEILTHFIRKTLSLIKMIYPNDRISAMVLTGDCLTPYLIELLYKVFERLGIYKDRIRIRDHQQCYLYYVLNQSKEIWNNETGLFDFSINGLNYYEFSLERHQFPMTAKVTRQDLSGRISYEMLMGKEPGLNYIFENISGSLLHKKVLSALYVTGVEFDDGWVVPVLEKIQSSKRMRIFIGANIYAKGALYGAYSTFPGGKYEDCIFFSETSVKYSLSIKGYKNAGRMEYFFCRSGMPWYDIKENIEVLLDGRKKLEFQVYDSNQKSLGCFGMKLSGLPKRNPRMTRLEIRLFFSGNDTLILQAKDKGFGSIYPSSNMIWEETVKI